MKTFLVTGASSGIGLACAQRLAAAGHRLVLVARNEAKLREAASELPGGPHRVQSCDVSDEIAVEGFFKTLRADGMLLDGMVHCAGIHWLRPLQLTDSRALNEMLHSHVISAVALARALVMQKVVSPQGCAVVWLSSAAALQGNAVTVAYAAAKGALISAARALAAELARRKVRVNVLVPGVVRTPQSEGWMKLLPPEQILAVEKEHLLGIGTADDVAGPACFLLSDDARWITGTTLVVDGGLTL
ncbi:MAG: SDR family oxidoreductase [Verrucomicrobiota bacterium]